MAITARSIISDKVQAHGKRRIRYLYETDGITKSHVITVERDPGFDADAELLSLEPTAEAQIALAEGSKLQGRLEDEADWDNADGRPEHRKEIARAMLQVALSKGIGEADEAWRLAKKVIPWVLDQGWSNAQIRTFLGITQPELGTINQWWNLMSTGTINDTYRQAWIDIRNVFEPAQKIRFGD